jgi:hypothetical protein
MQEFVVVYNLKKTKREEDVRECKNVFEKVNVLFL